VCLHPKTNLSINIDSLNPLVSHYQSNRLLYPERKASVNHKEWYLSMISTHRICDSAASHNPCQRHVMTTAGAAGPHQFHVALFCQLNSSTHLTACASIITCCLTENRISLEWLVSDGYNKPGIVTVCLPPIHFLYSLYYITTTYYRCR
jgi:hypothetical protein